MKKKVLFILHSLGVGGAEKVLFDILKNFDYNHFEVELLLVYNEGEYLQYLPKKVKLRSLYLKKTSLREKIDYHLYIRFGLLLGYKQSIRSKVSKQYNTIISFGEGLSLRFHSYIFNQADRNISWVHTDLLNNHYTIGGIFSSFQEQQAYAMMDSIVFVSNDSKKQFERLYPCNKVKKEVILNPIDYNYISSYRKEYKCDNRCFNIVSVGRLVSVKAYDRLIRLAKRLREDNYNFYITIIGEGSERGKLESLIVEYGLENSVSLLGFVNPPYFKMVDADLFLMTSLAEGYPLVLCEAFCLGLPVVSTKTTGPIELIDDNKYGILVDHDDESIYQGVKRMINDEQLRLYYHNKSLERAKMFNINETMKCIFNIL